MEVSYVQIDEVYAVHERMVEIGGGRARVRDFTLLHSAVERPKATFGGYDMYKTVWLKAGALMQSLVMNHPFSDGNKRTGYFSTHLFLRKNGYDLIAEKNELISFCLQVDNEGLTVEQIASWLKNHSAHL